MNTKNTMGTLALLCIATCAQAGDWPNWRGPHHNGISDEKISADAWPKDGPPIVWKASVGVGFSSVVVSDGRLITMGHADGQDTVHCLDAATGKKIWSHSYKSKLDPNLFEGGPTATPTAAGDSLYVLSRWGDVFRFDAATGKVQWAKNVAKENKMPVPSWGFSGSPMVVGDVLLLNVGEAGMALDAKTGKVVWQSAKEEAGYSTPLPVTRNGKQCAIVSSGRAYACVEVKTGKVAWQHPWLTRYGVNAADPIVTGDLVFVSTGYGKGSTLLELGKDGPTEKWRERRNLRNQQNGSVLIDGHVYGFDGDAGTSSVSLKCIELKTGKEVWKDASLGFGTLTAADAKLIVLTARGELIVAEASPKGFIASARAKVLTGKCWTVPVLANGRAYCRNASGDLVSVDVHVSTKVRP